MHCPSFLANNNIWVSLIVGGLANGFLYALIALGYTLVYGVLRLINFAHSEVVMAGGFGGLFAMRAVLGTSTPAGFWAIWFMLIGIVAGAARRRGDRLRPRAGRLPAVAKAQRTQAHLPHQRHRGLLLPVQPRRQGVRAVHGVHPDAGCDRRATPSVCAGSASSPSGS